MATTTEATEATESASYYQVLGVKRDASGEAIRDAFKRLVLTKHPDHGGDEQDFIAVQTAYEVLADRRKRRIYDRYGESGLEVSELFKHVASSHADDLAVIRSMTTRFPEHTSANYLLHTGFGQQGRPSMGAWVSYGLGSMNRDLPGFVVLDLSN